MKKSRSLGPLDFGLILVVGALLLAYLTRDQWINRNSFLNRLPRYQKEIQRPINKGRTQSEANDILNRVMNKDHLMSTKEVAIYERLDEAEKDELMFRVTYHCNTSFHLRTCLHYAMTCGKACSKFIKKSSRSKIRAEYDYIKKHGQTSSN